MNKLLDLSELAQINGIVEQVTDIALLAHQYQITLLRRDLTKDWKTTKARTAADLEATEREISSMLRLREMHASFKIIPPTRMAAGSLLLMVQENLLAIISGYCGKLYNAPEVIMRLTRKEETQIYGANLEKATDMLIALRPELTPKSYARMKARQHNA